MLSPDRCWTDTESDTNNDALVLRVSLGDDVVLFATEPEEPAQEVLLESGVDLTADVLKVPHHGAATSLPEFFPAVDRRGRDRPRGGEHVRAPGPVDPRRDRADRRRGVAHRQHGTVTVVFGPEGPTASGAR